MPAQSSQAEVAVPEPKEIETKEKLNFITALLFIYNLKYVFIGEYA
jgi:hypothetical protein